MGANPLAFAFASLKLCRGRSLHQTLVLTLEESSPWCAQREKEYGVRSAPDLSSDKRPTNHCVPREWPVVAEYYIGLRT